MTRSLRAPYSFQPLRVFAGLQSRHGTKEYLLPFSMRWHHVHCRSSIPHNTYEVYLMPLLLASMPSRLAQIASPH